MRIALILLAFGGLLGCATPEVVRQGLANELADLQKLEAELLPLVPDGPPVDFGGGVAYRPPDGWRLLLRAMQARAASLVAWAHDEPFDAEAAYQALLVPALETARRRAQETP